MAENNLELPEFKHDRWIKYHIIDDENDNQKVAVEFDGYGVVPTDQANQVESDTNKLRLSRLTIESITSFVTLMHQVGFAKEHYLKVIDKAEEQLFKQDGDK